MNFLLRIPGIVILLFLFAACCRDCDSIMLPQDLSNYIGVQNSGSMVFVDTLHHDTARVVQTKYYRGPNVKARKQFPIDCEECGAEIIAMQFTGMGINDTSQHKFVYYAVLSAEGNVLTIKNADSTLLFISREINTSHILDSLKGLNQTFKQVLPLETISCSQDPELRYCQMQIPHFVTLYFAPGIGLVRYEAVNHPVYGDVIYQRLQ